jgi:hypothetical protein
LQAHLVVYGHALGALQIAGLGLMAAALLGVKRAA